MQSGQDYETTMVNGTFAGQPGHDFAPTRAPGLQKRHLGHGFAHFRAGGCGKAIFLAGVRADYCSLLLIQYISCQRIHCTCIDRFYNEFFRFQIQQKLHIGRKSQQLTFPAIVIENTFFQRLFVNTHTFSYRLLAQIYTFSSLYKIVMPEYGKLLRLFN